MSCLGAKRNSLAWLAAMTDLPMRHSQRMEKLLALF